MVYNKMANQTKTLILRISPEMLAMLDAFVCIMPVPYPHYKKNRSKAARYILKEFLSPSQYKDVAQHFLHQS